MDMFLERLSRMLFGDPVVRHDDRYPKTFHAETDNADLSRPMVFDPALQQFSCGVRAGEPQFRHDETAQVWHQSRNLVLSHILRSIADCPAGSNLVLRGSAVMVAWFPQQARRPGDLDFVTIPPAWRVHDQKSQNMIQTIVGRLRNSEVTSAISIPDQSFAMEEIWVYEKAPGIRIIVPWVHESPVLNGSVQLDIVFNERMAEPPVRTSISLPGCEPLEFSTATAEQSLAWKLAWLCTDTYPMGKDLYDAVLLAESVSLSRDCLKTTFLEAETDLSDPMTALTREALLDLDVDWDSFMKEYPWVDGTLKSWCQRLVAGIDDLL